MLNVTADSSLLGDIKYYNLDGERGSVSLCELEAAYSSACISVGSALENNRVLS